MAKSSSSKATLSQMQTQRILSMWTNYQASQYLSWMTEVLYTPGVKLDAGPLKKQFHEILHGIRADTLPDLEGFETRKGSLRQFVEDKFPEAEKLLVADFKHCLELISQENLAPETIHSQLKDYIESRRKRRMKNYMDALFEDRKGES